MVIPVWNLCGSRAMKVDADQICEYTVLDENGWRLDEYTKNNNDIIFSINALDGSVIHMGHDQGVL